MLDHPRNEAGAAMRVDELASHPTVTCRPDATLSEVAALMRDRDVGCVVVVDDGRPVGICTDRDLAVRALPDAWPHQTPIRCLMTTAVVTLPADCDVLRAAEVMGARGYRRIPVVAPDGRLLGVLSLDDVAPALAGETDRLLGVLRGSKA